MLSCTTFEGEEDEKNKSEVRHDLLAYLRVFGLTNELKQNNSQVIYGAFIKHRRHLCFGIITLLKCYVKKIY